MKNKIPPHPRKRLSRTGRKLRKTLRRLGMPKELTHGDRPAWLTALTALAGAIATALIDRDKRQRLIDIVAEAKKQATEVLSGNVSGEKGHEEDRRIAVH